LGRYLVDTVDFTIASGTKREPVSERDYVSRPEPPRSLAVT